MLKTTMAHTFKCSLSTAERTGLNRSSSRSNKVAGFSLVEVLVSIIILSFGLLGMVGLQAGALRSNRETRTQSTAVVLARELAETIRGNMAEGLLPVTTNTATTNSYVGAFSSSPLTATSPSYCLSVATGTTPCAGAHAIANAQMTEWLARVDAELPGARVTVCLDSTPFNAAGIPQWGCTGAGTLVIKIGWTRSSTDKTQTGNNALVRAATPSVVVPVPL